MNQNRIAALPGAVAAVINLLNVFGIVAWTADQVAVSNLAAAAVLGLVIGGPAVLSRQT